MTTGPCVCPDPLDQRVRSFGQKKSGKGGSIQKQPGELIGLLIVIPQQKREKHGNNFSRKTSQKSLFTSDCFFPWLQGSCLYKFSWTGLKMAVILPSGPWLLLRCWNFEMPQMSSLQQLPDVFQDFRRPFRISIRVAAAYFLDFNRVLVAYIGIDINS